MTKQTIKRDGLPPIAFFGEQIGSGSSHSHRGDGQNRWCEVKIHRTKGGKYIAHVRHLTCWQGERNTSEAVSRATAGEIIDWLRDNNGYERAIGSVSQEAVEEAATVDAAFAAAWVEMVE